MDIPAYPTRPENPKRTLTQWFKREYPLYDGCIIKPAETCPHGLTIRFL